MKTISSISDIHIKFSNDSSSKILRKFCLDPKVRNSDAVVFLGDIFDLFLGVKSNFYKIFSLELNLIEDLSKVTKVYYVEGNHDLFLTNTPISQKIQVITDELCLGSQGEKILFTHGDYLNKDDKYYHLYRRFLSTRAAYLLAQRLIPYSFIKYFGTKASINSKMRSKKYFNLEKNRDSFRHGAIELGLQRAFKLVVAGHSHICDQYEKDGVSYVNNGYPIRDRKFLYIKEGIASLEPL